MSKEEPAWKAELSADIECAIGLNQDCGGAEGVYALRDHVFAAMEAHILAAEQRGFQAGVNKTGDSVGKLREQLKTAEERGRQQALSSFICGVCGHRVGWIDCPTGGWWAHEVHPSDDHDAMECVPESGNDS